jgi:hypothetical protein
MKKILLISLFLMNSAHAAFMIETMSGFSSSSDSKSSTNISDVSNHIFVGAALGSKQQFFIGQSVSIISQQVKMTVTNKVNTLELGPRFTYFFTQENVFYASLGWNPYAKGKRTVSSVTEEISGFSLLGSLGAELKINRNFHIGGSLNYHSLSISKAISSANVATNVSNSYTSLMPMINLSLRFR